MPCTLVRGRRTYRKVESTVKGETPEERISSREGHLFRSPVCGEVMPDAWDTFGSFVCGREVGHDGPHRSKERKRRPVIEWKTVEQGES